MRLRRCFLSLGFLALLGLLAVAPTAAAADTTIVWQVNLTVPLTNKAALGTLTTSRVSKARTAIRPKPAATPVAVTVVIVEVVTVEITQHS